jgi:ethanolamine ammonia-lyase small subunit
VSIDREALRRLVKAVVEEVMAEGASVAPAAGGAEETFNVAPRPKRLDPARRPLPPPRKPEAIERLVRANPARLVQGRAGTRYLTEVYVGLRADHAIALDAVHSEIPEGWAAEQGWLELRSRAADHQQFLLHPDAGRRLDDASRQKLEREGQRGADVVIIAGDGLSAHALMVNGPALVRGLLADLPAAGFKVAPPVFVKHARIGVQDEIGLILGAKASLIIVGERPGLGTGDSLSIYTAFGPKLGQDNSEKDCISNVRSLGLPPPEASRRCADLLRRTFAAGGGGVRLV